MYIPKGAFIAVSVCKTCSLYHTQTNSAHTEFPAMKHGILACTNPLNEVLQMTLDIIRQDLEERADSELTRLQGIYSR